MKIYKIKSDFENYYSFMIDNGKLFGIMPTYSAKYKAKPRLKEWVVPNSQFYKSANHNRDNVQIPDITTWPTGNLILNEKSYTELASTLAKFGEFLETRRKGIPYYIFNSLTVIPDEYIDAEQTKVNEESGIFIGLESLAFKDFVPNEYMVFKTSADKLANTYCSEIFHNLVASKSLIGLIFSSDLCSH